MNENEWDNFKKSVEPIKKVNFSKGVRKKIVKKLSANPKDVREPDLDTVVSKSWGTIEKNTYKRIFRNQIKVSKKLDLHGLSVNESKIKVFEFITDNFDKKKRLLLIICGKGKRLDVSQGWQGTGILNKKVPEWLNSKALYDKVLWFDYAKPENGGKGAYIVYLRKIRE